MKRRAKRWRDSKKLHDKHTGSEEPIIRKGQGSLGERLREKLEKKKGPLAVNGARRWRGAARGREGPERRRVCWVSPAHNWARAGGGTPLTRTLGQRGRSGTTARP